MKVQLHERIGSAIETVFAENVEDLLPELAHHYSRSANRAKALEFLHRAGEQAMNGRTPMIARVYHGYMDESGTDDKSEVVAVAGYLATYEQWIAFEKEWESLMREYRVEDFHMNVFEAYQRELPTGTGGLRKSVADLWSD